MISDNFQMMYVKILKQQKEIIQISNEKYSILALELNGDAQKSYALYELSQNDIILKKLYLHSKNVESKKNFINRVKNYFNSVE